MIQALLLDIEGTVCSIRYVHDVLFPYAKSAAATKIPALAAQFPVSGTITTDDKDKDKDNNNNNNTLLSYLRAFPEPARQSTDRMLEYINDLIDRDVKDPALKSLQGYLWEEGYASGEIKAPVYADSIDAIIKYSKELSLGVSIYSSGSVPAQKLLFKHTQDPKNEGDVLDLTKYLNKYYDTVNAGAKIDDGSYIKIAKDLKVENPSDILFLSDNPKEVDAAKKAGLQSYIVVRPGNAPLPEGSEKKYKIIETLDGVL